MPEPHPYPDIWQRLRSLVEANPTPAGEWRLIEGEHRLIGAVQHAQAEPGADPSPEERTGDGAIMDSAKVLTAAAEAIEDTAVRLIGRDLGTTNRDRIVAAGLAAALRLVADGLAAGPPYPLPPSSLSTLLREWADDFEAIDAP